MWRMTNFLVLETTLLTKMTEENDLEGILAFVDKINLPFFDVQGNARSSRRGRKRIAREPY